MTKILIDTNIFLGLYESNKDTVDIFKDIGKIKTKLVLPQQIYDEFLRNRDQILRKLIKDIDDANKKGMHLTALIRHSAEYKPLNDAKKKLSEMNDTLIQKIEEMISDPTKDPIFSRFTKLYKSKQVTTIDRSDALIQKAFFRKLSGNPPISPKQDSIGDEIIWESILEHVNDNLILVTRDGTYKAHSTFLTEEYRERTGRSLSIFDKMSDALKKVGEAPSDKLVQFEEEQRTLPFHSDLNLTKSHFKAINLATTEGLKNYFDAIDMARRCLHDMDLAMSSVETINAIDRYLAEINRVKSYLEDMDRVNYLVEEKKSDDGDETQSEDSGEQ